MAIASYHTNPVLFDVGIGVTFFGLGSFYTNQAFMNKIIFSVSTILLLVIIIIGSEAQKITGFGLAYKAGVTYGKDKNNSNNLFLETTFVSSAAGLYKVINLHKDTASRMINYLRVDLYPFSYRKGLFEVNNNAVKITGYFIDLDVLVPVRFRISSTLDVYAGAGPAINFLIKQDVKQNGTAEIVEEQRIQYGLIGEIGAITKGSTNFGIRTYNGFSKYPVTEVSVFFGIGLSDIYNSRKR